MNSVSLQKPGRAEQSGRSSCKGTEHSRGNTGEITRRGSLVLPAFCLLYTIVSFKAKTENLSFRRKVLLYVTGGVRNAGPSIRDTVNAHNSSPAKI